MKILIVEDDPGLREMLALTVAKRLGPKFELALMENFSHVLRYFVGEHTLLLAENLDEALREIREADGVLCDGCFPGAGCRVSGVGEDLAPGTWRLTPKQNWPPVLGMAAKRQIPFALLSGDDDLVTRAKLQGVAAFQKPFGTTAAINWLFEAMGGKAGVGSRELGQENETAA